MPLMIPGKWGVGWKTKTITREGKGETIGNWETTGSFWGGGHFKYLWEWS